MLWEALPGFLHQQGSIAITGYHAGASAPQVSVPVRGNWSAPVFTPAESGQMMHMDRLCILEGLEEVITKA